MRLGPGLPDLTYCTNIHPANGWGAVLASLRRHAPALAARLGSNAPLGLGLRLSSEEAGELLAGNRLEDFAKWLAAEGLYVALLNGYPFGSFHGQRVKESVFAPDWRDPRRLFYTLQLASILSRLLPEGADGGISTIPLSSKRWVSADDGDALHLIARNVKRVGEALAELYDQTGRLIHLDIEPEPGGLIENTAEAIRFFAGLFQDDPDGVLRRHVGICYDACHFAVAYEDPEASIRVLQSAGIRIGRVQVSSALRVLFAAANTTREPLEAELRAMAESPYLHQVMERKKDGRIQSYPDLGDALAHIHDPLAEEWRIHFHVPVFLSSFGPFSSTQADLQRVVALAAGGGVTEHLEIETYTWHILPDDQRLELVESIEREFRWTRIAVCGKPLSSTLLD